MKRKLSPADSDYQSKENSGNNENVAKLPIYVRTPQAFPLVIHLPNHETILAFGSQVVYTHYYRTYGTQLCGLPPHLWMHIAVFLPHEHTVALESSCQCLSELLGDEECWRLYCVDYIDGAEKLARQSGSCANQRHGVSETQGKVMGPASPLDESELHKFTFCWSWRQTAQQLVWNSAADGAQDFDQIAYKDLEYAQRPDVVVPTEMPVFPTHSLQTARCSGSKPLLIRDDLSNYFHGDWSLQALVREFGAERCNVLLRIGVTCEFSMTLANFVAYLRVTADRVPLYLFESRLPPSLQQRVVLPRLFEDNFLTELSDPAFGGRQWLLIGGAGSGLSFHVDPFGCSAWNALLQGRKRWALYPPQRIPPGVTTRSEGHTVVYDSPPSVAWFNEVYPLLDPDMRPVELIQEAGDIVFIPHGWWHCVVNLTETVAFTQNVINRHNAPEAARQLQQFEPTFSVRLRAALASRHCDD